MKKIVILGASGSIGTQTLDIVFQHPKELSCIGISVGRNLPWLRAFLAKRFIPMVCVQCKEDAEMLEKEFKDIVFLNGEEGLRTLSTLSEAEMVVNALVGFVGLVPTLEAIQKGKEIGLANKETLVVAGKLIIEAAAQHHVEIRPIDSEHSAIFQCLQGNRVEDVHKLWITASGGSFRDKTREQLCNVTLAQALAHPNWSMGAKITIDSATMVNKAFEVIEAHWLFKMPYAKIEAILHPESVVHSMVEYADGSIIAQLGSPDMRLPIQYALLPDRRYGIKNHQRLKLSDLALLHFATLDHARYPLFYRIIEEAQRGGNRTTVVNAANEVAVGAFLEGKIDFIDIETMICSALDEIPFSELSSLNDILRCDRVVREATLKKIGD